MSEKRTQTEIMLAVSTSGAVVFRNNCGVAVYPDGSRVKYGVCNPGGSDLIGWRTVSITPEMVGKDLAVFLALEVKTKTSKSTTEDQKRFIENVRRAGGIAGIVRSTDDAIALLNPLL
jgi:hypothetical protein